MGRSNFWPRIEIYNINTFQADSAILLRPASTSPSLANNPLGFYGGGVASACNARAQNAKSFVAALCFLGMFSPILISAFANKFRWQHPQRHQLLQSVYSVRRGAHLN